MREQRNERFNHAQPHQQLTAPAHQPSCPWGRNTHRKIFNTTYKIISTTPTVSTKRTTPLITFHINEMMINPTMITIND